MCASPSAIFNPSTTGTYNLATQATYNKGTEAIYTIDTQGVYSLTGQIVCDSNQICASSIPPNIETSDWSTVSIVTTALLSATTVVGWGLYLYGKCASKAAQPHLVENNYPAIYNYPPKESGASAFSDARAAFLRDTSSQNLVNHVAASSVLQVFIPVLIMNVQMQVTNLALLLI